MLQALPFARLRAWKSAILGRQHGPQIRAALRTCWGCHDFLGCNWSGAGYFHGREDAMGWRFAMGCGSDFGPKRLRSTAMAAEPGQGSPQLRGAIPPVHIDPASSWVGWQLIFGAFQGLILGGNKAYDLSYTPVLSIKYQ